MGGCTNGSKKYMGSLVLCANIYRELQHLPELILFQAHLIDTYKRRLHFAQGQECWRCIAYSNFADII